MIHNLHVHWFSSTIKKRSYVYCIVTAFPYLYHEYYAIATRWKHFAKYPILLSLRIILVINSGTNLNAFPTQYPILTWFFSMWSYRSSIILAFLTSLISLIKFTISVFWKNHKFLDMFGKNLIDLALFCENNESFNDIRHYWGKGQCEMVLNGLPVQ